MQTERRNRGVLLAIVVLFWFAQYVYVPFQTPYLTSLQVSAAFIGVIVGAYGVTQMTMRLPVGDGNDSQVDEAQAEASAQMAAIITQQTQSYILDKADTLGVCLEVGVELNEEMVPWRVTMAGEASPYARQRLEGIIQDDLGIPAERQVWSP